MDVRITATLVSVSTRPGKADEPPVTTIVLRGQVAGSQVAALVPQVGQEIEWEATGYQLPLKLDGASHADEASGGDLFASVEAG